MAHITHSVYARAGLLGNPSDGYGGKAIALSLGNFACQVSLSPADVITIQPHEVHDRGQFGSLEDLASCCAKYGYTGGVHLLKATCKKFYDYCKQRSLLPPPGQIRPFSLSYDTNIPRQLGLSGSSALIYAALQCLMEHHGVQSRVPLQDRPGLVLSVEQEELGITAGWMDRVIQVYGGVCYIDFGGLKHQGGEPKSPPFECSPMDPQMLPPLFLVWADSPSESGKVHSRVKQRYTEGDPEIVQGMADVAQCAEEGREVLINKDWHRLAQLMNTNFDLRRKMFGDAVIGTSNLQMVEVARSVGAACKFAGSGGAVVVLCPDGATQEQALLDAAAKNGLHATRIAIAPPAH